MVLQLFKSMVAQNTMRTCKVKKEIRFANTKGGKLPKKRSKYLKIAINSKKRLFLKLQFDIR